jgi:DNA-3-methyladenine glycosylase
MRLDRAFYQQPTLQLAKQLLGMQLFHRTAEGLLSGWIVEVEGYLWRNDPACHAARGMNNKNRAMFGPPGTLYVYCIHASWCMNVVTEIEGRGAAVLIRALQPIQGIQAMQARRGTEHFPSLTNGPGKLCQSFTIDRACNGIDLCNHDSLWIERPVSRPKFRIQKSPRIGITQGTSLPYRYFIDTNRFVSGTAREHSRPKISMLPSGDEIEHS